MFGNLFAVKKTSREGRERERETLPGSRASRDCPSQLGSETRRETLGVRPWFCSLVVSLPPTPSLIAMATRDSGGVYGPRSNQFPRDKHEIRSTRTIGRSFGGDISRYDPTAKQRTTADKTSDHDAVTSDHSRALRALAETNIETITETIALSPIDKTTTMHSKPHLDEWQRRPTRPRPEPHQTFTLRSMLHFIMPIALLVNSY